MRAEDFPYERLTHMLGVMRSKIRREHEIPVHISQLGNRRLGRYPHAGHSTLLQDVDERRTLVFQERLGVIGRMSPML